MPEDCDLENCDLAVVGAGPAGIAAAVSAAEAGLRVLMIDDNPRAGGQIWRPDLDRPAPARARAWLDRAAALGPQLVQLRGHAVVDADPRPTLWVHDGGHAPLRRLRARSLILACGARERFLPFPGWTLPGVIGVGGLQALCKQGFDPAAKTIVLAGSGPLLPAVAADLLERGALLPALVEQAPRRAMLGLGAALLGQAGKRGQAAALAMTLAGVPRRWSSWVSQAHGRAQLEAVTITHANGQTQTLPCDLLAVGFGLVPEGRLAQLLGCALAPDGGLVVDSDQRSSTAGVFAAGEQCGIAGVDAALLEGEIAGRVCAGQRPSAALLRARASARSFAARLDHAFALRPELAQLPTPQTIVCRCEDVTWAALQAWPDLRSAKLHSRCGMGSCQGRVCEPALKFLLGWAPGRCRPPLRPLPLSALSLPPTSKEPPCNSKA